VTSALVAVPSLPRNACKNNSLPQAWGTNFPVSTDPAGWGDNVTAIGWEGNYWPVFAYSSGAFFARGVGTGTYKIAYGKSTYVGTTVCGAMYSFGVATTGGKPAAGSVSWTMDQNYQRPYLRRRLQPRDADEQLDLVDEHRSPAFGRPGRADHHLADRGGGGERDPRLRRCRR
jgi:hypothetical protein